MSTIQLSTRLAWTLSILSVITLPFNAAAQCSDGVTTTRHHNGNVQRSASNQVWSWAQSYVTGTYSGTWTTVTSATTAHDGGQTHSGQNSAGSNQTSTVQWYDAPSTVGSGSYTDAERHEFISTCGDDIINNDNSSLTVQTPTITTMPGQPFSGYLWNLGSGSSDPLQSNNEGYFYQSAPLQFNSNCGPSDTCNDTPQWSLATANGQTQLSTTSGASVTLRKGSNQGDCQFNSSLSASIGGFLTGAYAIMVNSPKSTAHYSSMDQMIGINNPPTGYITYWHLGVEDACATPNAVSAMPMNETFPNGVSPAPGTSGWNVPNSAKPSWEVGDWTGNTFIDSIGDVCAQCTPPGTWTVGNPPFVYNTVLASGSHYFYAGTITSAMGWSVYTGTIQYFQDHGANNP